MKLIYSINKVNSVIENSEFIADFISYLKNTTTEATHQSNAFGTKGSNGSNAYDVLGVKEHEGDYQFDMNSYDGQTFLYMLQMFIMLTNNKYNVNFHEVNQYKQYEHDYFPEVIRSLKFSEQGEVSYFSMARRYGTLVTNAETTEKLGLQPHSKEKAPMGESAFFQSAPVNPGGDEVDSSLTVKPGIKSNP